MPHTRRLLLLVSTLLAPALVVVLVAVSAHGAALDGKVVVIDPGHNPGNAAHTLRIVREVDAGTLRKACDTVGAQAAEGYPEWRHNLRVARRLARILRHRGASVVLTHDGRRPTRARIANQRRADVAISIHADGNTGQGRGFHIIHPASIDGLTDDIAAASYRLARDVRRGFRKATKLPLSNYVGEHGLHRPFRYRGAEPVRRPQGPDRGRQPAKRARRDAAQRVRLSVARGSRAGRRPHSVPHAILSPG